MVFTTPVVLIDLVDRFLDKRQSALLILTVVGTVSGDVALRTTQRQHAAETAHGEGATTESEQKNPGVRFIVFDECR
jgi:hypothetical protein